MPISQVCVTGANRFIQPSLVRALCKFNGSSTPVSGRVDVPLLFTDVDHSSESRGGLISANREEEVSGLREPGTNLLKLLAVVSDLPEIVEGLGFAVAVPSLAEQGKTFFVAPQQPLTPRAGALDSVRSVVAGPTVHRTVRRPLRGVPPHGIHCQQPNKSRRPAG